MSSISVIGISQNQQYLSMNQNVSAEGSASEESNESPAEKATEANSSKTNTNQLSSSQSGQNTVSSRYTAVTSYDPTMLKQQKSQIENQIAQLQKSGDNSSQIQKLNEALSTVKQRLKKPGSASAQSQGTGTTVSTSKPAFFNQIDIKA